MCRILPAHAKDQVQATSATVPPDAMSEVLGTIAPCYSLLLLPADFSCLRCRELVQSPRGDMNHRLACAFFGMHSQLSCTLSATSCSPRRATASFGGGPHIDPSTIPRLCHEVVSMCSLSSLSSSSIGRPSS